MIFLVKLPDKNSPDKYIFGNSDFIMEGSGTSRKRPEVADAKGITSK